MVTPREASELTTFEYGFTEDMSQLSSLKKSFMENQHTISTNTARLSSGNRVNLTPFEAVLLYPCYSERKPGFYKVSNLKVSGSPSSFRSLGRIKQSGLFWKFRKKQIVESKELSN